MGEKGDPLGTLKATITMIYAHIRICPRKLNIKSFGTPGDYNIKAEEAETLKTYTDFRMPECGMSRPVVPQLSLKHSYHQT